MGNPDPEHVSSSVADRHNRSMHVSMDRFTRDSESQPCIETLEEVRLQVPAWSEHDNQEAPRRAVAMQSPAEFAAGWHVTDKQRPIHN